MAPKKRLRQEDVDDDEVVAIESANSTFRNDPVSLLNHESLFDIPILM